MKSKRDTVERLKQMDKNSPTHAFRTLGRIFKYGIIGYGRNIWLSITSTIVMTLTLVLLFATVVASMILSSTASSMRDKIDITVYFKPGTSETMLSSMSSTMKSDGNVKEVEYTTSEQEYDIFIKETEESGNTELLATFTDEDGTMKEIMIKTMPATMRIKVYDAESLDSIKKIVNENKDFVANKDSKEPSYNTNSQAIDTIVNWSNIARIGGLGLSALFLLISVLVIFNTIRMAIYSRSEEIYMEKLVGADNRFIRGPFLVESMISGLAAGVLGGVISIIVINIVTPKLKSYDIDVSVISEYINLSNVAIVFLIFLGIGLLIALISSRLAVHKYLKRM